MPVLVVPAYEEEANLPRLLAELEARPELWAGGRLIVVDDGSADATARIAAEHEGAMPVEVIRLGRNLGPGRAFDRGLRRALELAPGDEDLIVTLEADTTSDLDALPAMLAAARGGADVVVPAVAFTEVRAWRRLLSHLAGVAVRRLARVEAHTVSSFLRVYRAGMLRRGYRRWADELIREPGFACAAEVLVKLTRLGARVAEVPARLDGSRRSDQSHLRVLPTVAGYVRLLARART